VPLLKVYRTLLGISMAVRCMEGTRALLGATLSQVWPALSINIDIYLDVCMHVKMNIYTFIHT